jgi:hypothetical protein
VDLLVVVLAVNDDLDFLKGLQVMKPTPPEEFDSGIYVIMILENFLFCEWFQTPPRSSTRDISQHESLELRSGKVTRESCICVD